MSRALQEQRVQRVEADHVGAAAGGEGRQRLQAAEVAHPPVRRGVRGVELRRDPPDPLSALDGFRQEAARRHDDQRHAGHLVAGLDLQRVVAWRKRAGHGTRSDLDDRRLPVLEPVDQGQTVERHRPLMDGAPFLRDRPGDAARTRGQRQRHRRGQPVVADHQHRRQWTRPLGRAQRRKAGRGLRLVVRRHAHGSEQRLLGRRRGTDGTARGAAERRLDPHALGQKVDRVRLGQHPDDLPGPEPAVRRRFLAFAPEHVADGQFNGRQDLVRKIGQDRQRALAVDAPGDADGLRPDQLVAAAATADPCQQRQDTLAPDGQDALVPGQHSAMRLVGELGPGQAGEFHGTRGGGVGNPLAARRVAELGKASELLAPAAADSVGEFGAEIAEERERLRRPPFLAHEQHRDRGAQQIERGNGADRFRRRQGGDPVAHGAVADLVVVLQEGDERGGRQMGAGLAPGLPSLEGRRFALKRKSLGQGAAELRHVAVIVAVVAAALAGRRDVQPVVQVVGPLRVVPARLARGVELEPARLVGVVLEHEMDVSARAQLAANPFGEFRQQMARAVVDDRMDGIQPQAVEMELLEPIKRVVDHELADVSRIRAVVVDGSTPWRLVPLGEQRRVAAEVVALGAEVVVDHVEEDHQPAPVGGVDESLEILRAAIGRVGREQVDAVVAPVAAPGKSATGISSIAVTPSSYQVIELRDRGPEGALGRERADVELVEHGLLPGPPAPVRVGPGVGVRVHHLAGSVDIFRLVARRRIGDDRSVPEREPVAAAGRGPIGQHGMPAVLAALHRKAGVVARKNERDLRLLRRPEAEPCPSVGSQSGTERHVVRAQHAASPPSWT